MRDAALRELVDRLQPTTTLSGWLSELTAQIEELRRVAKRQAAPFPEYTRTPSPRRPGRNPGARPTVGSPADRFLPR